MALDWSHYMIKKMKFKQLAGLFFNVFIYLPSTQE